MTISRFIRRANGVKVPRAQYLLARTEQDYAKVQQLLKGTEFERIEVCYPTLMAYRHGKLVGVLGTRPSDKAVISGPLYVNVPAPQGAFVALRLAEAYEGILRTLGITMYVFSVDKRNKKQVDLIGRLGIEPYAQRAGKLWYLRRIGE
ncbi:MAG: hypothetical protein L0Y56_10155 [Nitrospira sp.]|nr:hypothetical protein [Nitrospira sp.]